MNVYDAGQAKGALAKLLHAQNVNISIQFSLIHSIDSIDIYI